METLIAGLVVLAVLQALALIALYLIVEWLSK